MSNIALRQVPTVPTRALCLLGFFSSSGSGGIGYGYFLLEAMEPVDDDGDLAGDNVLK